MKSLTDLYREEPVKVKAVKSMDGVLAGEVVQVIEPSDFGYYMYAVAVREGVEIDLILDKVEPNYTLA